MNTAELRAFAPAVRRALHEAVGRKLDVVLAAQTPDYRTTYAPQVAALRELTRTDRTGLIERVAYTWFNRLTALRYLDARVWHPFNARVLTAADPGASQPELLKLAREGALPEALKRHADVARLDDLLDGRIPSSNAQAEVYRHLVLAACRFYHALLPDLFERLDDATELLLPDDLLTEHSPVAEFRTAITDADCETVEVIGWLYQFYISEKKDEVMGRKAAVPTDDIPAVTQLFTPHWIVRYLVENSLGRLWLLNRPGSRLREQMPYYVETEPEADFLRVAGPEELRVLDPAVGSGHMLTCAFDLLYAIYEEQGYAPSDIPGLILRNNLFGIDIDPRAAQLAQLALVLKAREKARRFFQADALVQPQVIALQDVSFEPGEIEQYIRELKLGPLFDEPVRQLMGQFARATTFGSLIQPLLGAGALADLQRAIAATDVGGQLFLTPTHAKIRTVLAQSEYLARSYCVIATNPPYMGWRQLAAPMKEFAEQEYPKSKADLMAMFIERAIGLVASGGFPALLTMQSWMFQSSFEELREHLLLNERFITMAHLGARAFDSIAGEVVQATAFVMKRTPPSSSLTTFFQLVSGRSESEKDVLIRATLSGSRSDLRFSVLQSGLLRLPGSPLAYWLTSRQQELFESRTRLRDFGRPRQGLATTNNSRFYRFWFEPSYSRIAFGCASRSAARASAARWFPLNKGGSFRKWSGNFEYVIDYQNDGRAICDYIDNTPGVRVSSSGRVINREFYFQPGISYSDLTSGGFGARFFESGFVFDTTGPCIFDERGSGIMPMLGYVNSSLFQALLDATAPGLHYSNGVLADLPLLLQVDHTRVTQIVEELVAISKADWDSRETSWDFRRLPLLNNSRGDSHIEAAWEELSRASQALLARARALETENNRLFLDSYGLSSELEAEVPTTAITLRAADSAADSAALISYAVGCMMGRYSLDRPGLILADADATLEDFARMVGKPLGTLTFHPDEDGVIPVLDSEWFEDDAVARTREFLRVTFGDATLRENVRWIEQALGKDLRRYFLTDFYKDHLQTYRKRPIYWLVQSPGKGFACLIYLHRYTRDTLNMVLNRYLREYQGKLRNRLSQLAQQLAGDTMPARDRTAARKEQDRLTRVLHECEEWERQVLLPLAQQRIELDLDDGVKVNYQKLASVLAPIPGLAAAEE